MSLNNQRRTEALHQKDAYGVCGNRSKTGTVHSLWIAHVYDDAASGKGGISSAGARLFVTHGRAAETAVRRSAQQDLVDQFGDGLLDGRGELVEGAQCAEHDVAVE